MMNDVRIYCLLKSLLTIKLIGTLSSTLCAYLLQKLAVVGAGAQINMSLCLMQ